MTPGPTNTVVLFANTDWYLYNFRLPLALALEQSGYRVLMVSPPGEYGERLRASGLRWEPLAMDRRSLNPLREAKVVAARRREPVQAREPVSGQPCRGVDRRRAFL